MDVEGVKKLIGSDINKYTITRYINSGSFGHVVEGRNKQTDELVALKIPVKTDERDGQKSLLDEAMVYKHLSNPEHGVPNMKVTVNGERKIIVMDLLGPSLESLLEAKKRFSLKTIISLAIKMIDVFKYIHSCGYIHRDIKPDNFVIDREKKNKIYSIDFGLAKKFKQRNNEHIKFSDTKKFCGTARYASIAAHKCFEQGRKDDLEAIGYILIYMFKGKLPWQSIKNKDKKEKYKLIGEAKAEISEEELCKDMPKEFCVYLKYVRSLDFDEKPHYTSLKRMFEKLYESRNYKSDKLEWE